VLTVGVFGYKYLKAQASVPPSYITFVQPVTGEQLSLRATTITDYPEELWPQVIDQIAEHILATGEVPEPDELIILLPGTFTDDNGQIRDRCTNEILQPGQQGCSNTVEDRIPLDERVCVEERNGPATSGDQPASPEFPDLSIDDILENSRLLPQDNATNDFGRFFNSISYKDFLRLWDNPPIQRSIRAKLLTKTGENEDGFHEWLMRSRAPLAHCWGVTFEQVTSWTTPIPQLTWTIPDDFADADLHGEEGSYNNDGSGRFHNELGRHLDASMTLEEAKIRIDVLREKWDIDRDLIPPQLRLDR